VLKSNTNNDWLDTSEILRIIRVRGVQITETGLSCVVIRSIYPRDTSTFTESPEAVPSLNSDVRITNGTCVRDPTHLTYLMN